ncbi:MAG: hypothetical protein LH472_02090, partial [Pyrinomonadaceae bacterium]|nr:hypothetical protein [Pyrinomonadaceae bacterium]
MTTGTGGDIVTGLRNAAGFALGNLGINVYNGGLSERGRRERFKDKAPSKELGIDPNEIFD